MTKHKQQVVTSFRAGTRLDRVRPIYKHGHLDPTKRGWLFMGKDGGLCDKKCAHCYYAFAPALIFYSLDTLISHANLFRYHYDLEYCDISGGEATIYGPKKDGRRPELEALIAHCSRIGLKPTIITHGQNSTPELVKGVEDAGLEDWLISMHGMKEGHDKLVVNHANKGDGGWERLTGNLKNYTRPVRINTTIQNYNFHELPDQARWLVDNLPPTVWNQIQFNPFYRWDKKEVIEFQTPMTELAPFVGEAVQIAEAGGWEVNVRYFPFCVAEPYGFAKNCVTFFGTQIDPWEWSLSATNRVKKAEAPHGWHEANMRHCRAISASRENPNCNKCRFFRTVCEGPSTQYLKRYGHDELVPSLGEKELDPAYFEHGGSFMV